MAFEREGPCGGSGEVFHGLCGVFLVVMSLFEVVASAEESMGVVCGEMWLWDILLLPIL